MVLSSTAFGLRCLEDGLLGVPAIDVVGIVTTPPEIDISYSSMPVRISNHADFSDVAGAHRIPIHLFGGRAGRGALSHVVDRWRPDVLLALGWYYLVPEDLRALARYGCLGVHASLLPKYRGGAPVPWAIINGETRTGVTLFHLTDNVDAGDIVAQHEIPILPDDTVADVYARATTASALLLKEELPSLLGTGRKAVPQRHDDATFFPQRSPEDGHIVWSWTAQRVHNFVRAQTRPYPGAFTMAGGQRARVWRSRVALRAHEAVPGTVLDVGESSMIVACGRNTALEIVEWDGPSVAAGASLERAAEASR